MTQKKHRDRMAAEREVAASRRAAGLRYMNGHRMATSAEIAARLAEIPDDTRTLTQRICGDPIPERSALYRRMHGDQG